MGLVDVAGPVRYGAFQQPKGEYHVALPPQDIHVLQALPVVREASADA